MPTETEGPKFRKARVGADARDRRDTADWRIELCRENKMASSLLRDTEDNCHYLGGFLVPSAISEGWLPVCGFP